MMRSRLSRMQIPKQKLALNRADIKAGIPSPSSSARAMRKNPNHLLRQDRALSASRRHPVRVNMGTRRKGP
eukprot:2338367-Rhodomonas_salina.2